MITQEELKALLDYDEVTGVFTWKIFRGNLAKAGSIAGSLKPTGYVVIKVNKRLYMAHRLAWLYVYGSFPSMSLDHIDCVRNNNSITNLREASRSENSLNTGAYRSNSLFKGVSFHKGTSKWCARATLNKTTNSLGYFNTPEEAFLAYKAFALKNHGEFIHNSLGTSTSI